MPGIHGGAPPPDWIDTDPAHFYDAPLETLRHLYEIYPREAVLR